MKSPALPIIGSGLVCCLGRGVRQVYDAMCRGESGFRPLTRFAADAYVQQHAGQLTAELEQQLHAEFDDDDLAGAMVKCAGSEAMQALAWQPQAAPASHRGLILATNFGPIETQQWCWRERQQFGSMDAQTFTVLDQFVPQIAAYFGCGGPVAQLSLSCASGGAAAALARDWINGGRAAEVLAIAYDCLSEFCWYGLSNLRTISDDCLRPFDLHRSGTIFSEGAAAMLIAHPQAVSSRAVMPLAMLTGAAVNNNAFHMTAPAKDADGSRRVMAAALATAGIAAGAIDHICAHATGTVANDVSEAACFTNLFGAEHLADLTVAAHKSQFGHMLGAAGMAEAIITAEVLQHGIIPPTVNHTTADPACCVDCIAGNRARRKTVGLAITNSAGIGGNNAAMVLQKAEGITPA